MRHIILVFALWIIPAIAQEHDHGKNGIPDWYDPNCCNVRDCRPVEDSTIEFAMLNGQDIVRHKPTGAVFRRDQWKISQDERYHVCITTGAMPLCVYLRSGV